MPTSSITTPVVIKGKKNVQKFLKAVKKASKFKHKDSGLAKNFKEVKSDEIAEYAKYFK